MMVPFLLCFIALQLSIGLSAGSEFCEDGYYFSFIHKRCRKCSICPTNQIIKTPCTKYNDQKCSPFSFKDFQDASIEISKHNMLDGFYEEHDFYAINKKKNKKLPSQAKVYNEDMDSPPAMEKDDREYWKTLAFALIGLVTVLIIVASVVVLLACCRLQTVTINKQLDDGEADDADSGYVVIRSIRIIADSRAGNSDLNYFTREESDTHPPLLGAASSDMDIPSDLDPDPHSYPRQLCFLPKVYKPQRRLLNYDADDVFESEDSGSNCTFPNKYQTAAEKSMSADINANKFSRRESMKTNEGREVV